MKRSILFLTLFLMFGCSERAPVNIYESEKFRNLTQEEITIGESIWVTTCFRCHMYGTMGGTSVKDKEHFDKLAAKGIDQLYKSVLEGIEGEEGVMPPKGACYPCTEEEIELSVYYIFHLAKKVQTEIEQKEKK